MSRIGASSRRGFLHGCAVGALSALSGAAFADERRPVVVMTNHNDDTLSLIERGFEKAYPQYRVQIVWLMPPDAMRHLRDASAPSPDVWWQAAPHNHLADMAKDGFMQPLGLSKEGLPAAIGALPLEGEGDLFHASQLTAFGFLVNSKAVRAQNLPWPEDWAVLAGPAYAGKVAMSDPWTVRFGSQLLSVATQSFGWEKGWALLSAIAGNAVLMQKGLRDEVISGRQPVALHVDTVPNAEQRFRQPMERVYPEHGGIVNAGYIGLLKKAANVEGARAFASYVLSAEGQSLLPKTDLPRLPVRPEVYAALGAAQFDPFAAQAAGQFAFQPADDGGGRATAMAALFNGLVQDKELLSGLWRRVHAAETAGRGGSHVAEARRALEEIPVAADFWKDEAIAAAFRPRRRPESAVSPEASPAPQASAGPPEQAQVIPGQPNGLTIPEPAKPIIEKWRAAFRENQARASRLLDEAKA
ncbi:ABC transporter substrate-binding protein [Methylosinus sp. LW3]|uniref:ABC transporter substrate-binding protein n=1 Tax=Methylosinus sp. LW3 TaxID=107635 RepID=UPI000466FC61|nr:ABC transporter substrate-binding protein [Methylosinus sp. LW3]